MTSFQKEMEVIEEKLQEMATYVQAQMKQSVTILIEGGGSEQAAQVMKQDLKIDEFDEHIHGLILRLMMLQPPLPEELKILTAMMRIARELERIGDHAVNIAEMVQETGGNISDQINESIKQIILDMNRISVNMLEEVIEIRANKDIHKCDQIENKDEKVDALFADSQARLIDQMQRHPTDIPHLAPFFLVTRYLERSADHIVNIARITKQSYREDH